MYTGVTNDLRRRVLEHKQGLLAGFTKKYRIHRLVYFESFNDVREVLGREKRIKAWRRGKRVALIKSANLAWDGLAADW